MRNIILKIMLSVQLLFIVFMAQAGQEYSSLTFYPFSGKGPLPENSRQHLKGSGETVYAVQLPELNQNIEFRISVSIADDKVMIPKIVLLNESFQEIQTINTESAVDACDKQLTYQSELAADAHYMIVRPGKEGSKTHNLCWVWLTGANFILPLPYLETVTSSSEIVGTPELRLYQSWNEGLRFYTGAEVEGDGHSIGEEYDGSRPQTPSGLSVLAGIDQPWGPLTFIRLQLGIRSQFVNEQKGQRLYLGVNRWVSYDWNVGAGVIVDLNRHHIYNKVPYTGEAIVDYRNSVGVKLAASYRPGVSWQGEFAVNLINLETDSGINTPANSVSAALRYYFN